MASVAEATFWRTSSDRPGNLLLPLGISLLLHLLLVLLFLIRASLFPQPAATPFEVQILQPQEPAAAAKPQGDARLAEKSQPPAPAQPIPLPKNQMVSPPDSPEQKPDQTRLLSDRDSRTLEEMIKPGQPAPAAKPPQQRAKAEDNTKPSATEKRQAKKARGDAHGKEQGSALAKAESQSTTASTHAAPKLGLSDLFVRPSELARDPSLRKGESGDDDTTEKGGRRDLASLSRPDLWADPGQRGSPDYLPDVRLGDFTMLNTKADRFAPFVRRVGLRVFQSFSMEFKQMIFAGTVPQGRDNVEIEAVMSRDGRRLEVYLKQRSGNLSSDRVLLGSLNDHIFFDQNPPAQAVAQDGLIHFVFALNASVWYGHDENGRLQPGAHWILGAGLL